MLTILDKLPQGLLDHPASDLFKILKGPTLLHLPGEKEPPLYVSTLLHGNEDTGLKAIQRLLKRYGDKTLPRALSIFIGNVKAAQYGHRRLDDQPDYNRIWHNGPLPENKMAMQVFQEMKSRGVFASIDIHNNSGINPHHACVGDVDTSSIWLARRFSRIVVQVTHPPGLQFFLFSQLGPSVIVEAGQPGQAYGITHVEDFLEDSLQLPEIPRNPFPPDEIDLYSTVAKIEIPDPLQIGFGDEEADIRFLDDLDDLNFTELVPHTLIGWIKNSNARLLVSDKDGNDVGEDYLDYSRNEIRTKIPVIPSMFTLNKKIIQQDCLGYLMERVKLPLSQKGS